MDHTFLVTHSFGVSSFVLSKLEASSCVIDQHFIRLPLRYQSVLIIQSI